MDRRTFIRTAGATGLGFTSRYVMAAPQESPAMLLKLLEDSPRERLPAALVSRIRSGLSQEELLAALCLAAARNVQPYPAVGFKYHALMVLRSIALTTQHLPAAERWLPMIWAVDYFKDAQADERSSSGWHMRARPVRSVGAETSAQAARQALATALDRWDHEAADAAVTACVRTADPGAIFPLLFDGGMRDLRDVGHKAITVACVHSLVTRLGAGEASEALLRSTVAALLNSEGEPNPATHDLGPDRPWRRNRERLTRIPSGWKQGHDASEGDFGERGELRAALYEVSPEEAGGVVAQLLSRQISAQAIWEVLFETAAEILVHQPGIVPVHAQTTANALHYVYRTSDDARTQQLALLQCAAFIAMFREITRISSTDVNLPKLEPLPLEHPGSDPLEEIFADLAADHRLKAARKSLGYLKGGGDADKLIARVREHVVLGAEEAHDYKLPEAVFENHAQSSGAAWRARYLSAGMAYFKAPRPHPVPVVVESLKLLEG